MILGIDPGQEARRASPTATPGDAFPQIIEGVMATRNHSSSPPPEQLFHELAATLEFDRFFSNAARAAALAVDAHYAGLIRRHGQHLRYQFLGTLTADDDHRDLVPVRIADDHPAAAGPALAAGETLYIADSVQGPLAAPELAALGIHAHLLVPTRVAGRVEGALVLGWRTRPARAPGPRKRRLVEAFAAFIGHACYRSALEAALARDARHDPLTGLPNRGVLMDRLTHARRRAMRNDCLLVIALLDVDGFKGVNDELGHEAGDHLLTTVADRLAGSVRLADTVSRYGGDEFVIIMEDITQLGQVEILLERTLRATRQPILFQGRSLTVTISVGLTIYPFDDHPPNVLLQHADQAMYEAKRAGGGRYQCFAPTQTAPVHAGAQRYRDIEQALAHDLWRPSYQPIVDGNGRMAGLEARLRWRQPNGTIVREEAITNLTERDLRERLLERLLTLVRRDWVARGSPPVSLHINLQATDLYDPRLPARLSHWRAELYRDTQTPVILELSDTTLAAHAPAAQRLAAALGDQGFLLLVDHFPGGRAGLAHISAAPVYGVKCRPARDPADTRLLSALAAGIKALGLTLYADGVDNLVRQKAAERLGCRYGQGLIFAPELDARSAAHWFKTSVHSR
ncbi:diguanylate cyclase domain-containing protein [Acidiferrobacter sp. SPIII_3]|jgi:diguanylate cyclase (GGDEF)-like protein|uniref:diguanylate cyclase domain-containing protein n=1 Tax=Acidiferrobacter sp. SPIII_3 TaxID=1281578 RepID=UPI00143DB6D1|nr:diguanylate cyclase [Acidiferrobacter sp. SPIII_3]